MAVDYKALIKNGLEQRTRNPDLKKSHAVYRVPMYVVNMCTTLLDAIHGQGATHVTLEDVLLQDRCAAGHVDYLPKLALYCRELEISAPKAAPAP